MNETETEAIPRCGQNHTANITAKQPDKATAIGRRDFTLKHYNWESILCEEAKSKAKPLLKTRSADQTRSEAQIEKKKKNDFKSAKGTNGEESQKVSPNGAYAVLPPFHFSV